MPVYTTATAMPDPSCVYDLHHSLRQSQLLNPLSEARDGTRKIAVFNKNFKWSLRKGTILSITSLFKYSFLIVLPCLKKDDESFRLEFPSWLSG